MKNIPMPVVILLVVIALVAVVWSVRRSTGGGNPPTPTGPMSDEARKHMSDSGMATGSRLRGDIPGTTPGGVMGAPGGR